MGLIRFVQAHNRNKELRKARELEEQKLDAMENWEFNGKSNRAQLGNKEMNKSTSDETNKAIQHLKMRYAIDEITEEEYDHFIQQLELLFRFSLNNLGSQLLHTMGNNVYFFWRR